MNEELKKWAKNTIDTYKKQIQKIGEDKATSYYNQSNLKFATNCQLMIVGINPGAGCKYKEWGQKDSIDTDYILQGNPCFHGKKKEEILYILKDWALYRRLYSMLKCSGKEGILNDVSKFVLTNITLFGTLKESEIPKGVDMTECAKQTFALIPILNPRVIILLGAQCRKQYNRISNDKLKPLDGCISYSYYQEKLVLSIPHTAYHYSREEIELVGKVMGYALENNSFNIEEVRNRFAIEIGVIKKKPKSKISANELWDFMEKDLGFPFYEERPQLRRYKLGDNLQLTITSSEKGYCAIRLKDGIIKDGKLCYVDEDTIQSIQKLCNWKSNKHWGGIKTFSEFASIENCSQEIKAILSKANV